nr:right-handed parallel beta-helix repeat-containing protein [Chloroflexota bacterium]
MKYLLLLVIACLAALSCTTPGVSTEQGRPSAETTPSATWETPPIAATIPSATREEASAITTGNVYYVAPNGDNANPGTRDRPWRTPGYGSRQLHPGDTLIILGGRYILSEYDADIIAPPSGTATAWIIIQGEVGHRPVLAGRDNLITAIDLTGVQYVRIRHLGITHDDTARGEAAWFREGVEILGAPSAHIVLEDLYIHHIDEFGMNFQDVDNLYILNCRIEYAGFGALGGPAGEHGGWRNVFIRNSSLSWSGHYYQGGDGSDRPYDRPDGFGIEPSQGPILIEDTVAEHNYGDGLDSKAANTTIRRCIVANNSCDGVKLWGPNSRIENTLIYGRGDGDASTTPWAAIVIDQEQMTGASFEIINVTVDDFVGQNYLMYVQYDGLPVRLAIRNSIFQGRGQDCPIYVGGESTLIAAHNLFYLPQEERVLIHGDMTYTAANIGKLGPGNLYGDPRFMAPAWGQQGDYHLREGSPAINAGTVESAPSVDLENRPRDAHPDIGAYEYWQPAARLHLALVLGSH